MFKENLLKILLISLILAQNCFAKPTNNANEIQTTTDGDMCQYNTKYSKALKPSENDNQLAATVQLFKISMSALMDMSLTYAQKAKLISDQLLKEQEIINPSADNEETIDLKNNLQKFVESYRSCKDVMQLFDIVELFANATSSFYEQEEEGKLTTNGKHILSLLKKYDIEKMDKEFEASFLKFVTQFLEKYEDLKEKIKEEKPEVSKKINQWYEEFKTLKTYDDKIDYIPKFINFFE